MRYFVHFTVELSNSEYDHRLHEFSAENLPLIRNLSQTIKAVNAVKFPVNWGIFSPYVQSSTKEALRAYYIAAGYTVDELRKIDHLLPAVDNEYPHNIVSITLMRVEEVEDLLV